MTLDEVMRLQKQDQQRLRRRRDGSVYASPSAISPLCAAVLAGEELAKAVEQYRRYQSEDGGGAESYKRDLDESLALYRTHVEG